MKVVNLTINLIEISQTATSYISFIEHSPICSYDKITKTLYINIAFHVSQAFSKKSMFIINAEQFAFYSVNKDITQLPVVLFATRTYYTISLRVGNSNTKWQLYSRETAQSFAVGDYYLCACIKII